MKNHGGVFDPEAGVEPWVADFAEDRLSHQWDDYPAAVIVLQRRLDEHHIGNVVPMFSHVPMNIKLSHVVESK